MLRRRVPALAHAKPFRNTDGLLTGLHRQNREKTTPHDHRPASFGLPRHCLQTEPFKTVCGQIFDMTKESCFAFSAKSTSRCAKLMGLPSTSLCKDDNPRLYKEIRPMHEMQSESGLCSQRVGVILGAHFSSGRAGIAATMRYAFELSREGFKRRPIADAMPERQHTSP